MKELSQALFWLSNGLLAPVMVALLYLFVRAVLLVGALYGGYRQRRRDLSPWQAVLAGKDESDELLLQHISEQNNTSAFGRTLKQLPTASQPRRELLVGEFELASEASCTTAKMLTKFGPILGLMGTLIPMGPALVGLSTGAIDQMAYNMQVAFATTVLGLFVSAIGYIALHIQRRDAQRMLILLDYLVQKLPVQP